MIWRKKKFYLGQSAYPIYLQYIAYKIPKKINQLPNNNVENFLKINKENNRHAQREQERKREKKSQQLPSIVLKFDKTILETPQVIQIKLIERESVFVLVKNNLSFTHVRHIKSWLFSLYHTLSHSLFFVLSFSLVTLFSLARRFNHLRHSHLKRSITVCQILPIELIKQIKKMLVSVCTLPIIAQKLPINVCGLWKAASIPFGKITTTETQHTQKIHSFIHSYIVLQQHSEHSTNFFYCTHCYPLSIVQVSIVLRVLILPFQLVNNAYTHTYSIRINTHTNFKY